MTKAPCKFHLLQGACSSPVVLQRACGVPCSLQGYRLRCLCPGRNAAWPQRAAASCFSQPRVGCGHDALQIRDLTDLRRVVGACLKTRPTKAERRLWRRSRISGAPRRANTVRAGLQERVRRGTASGTHTPSSLRTFYTISASLTTRAVPSLRDAGSEAAAGSSQGEEGERCPFELRARPARIEW